MSQLCTARTDIGVMANQRQRVVNAIRDFTWVPYLFLNSLGGFTSVIRHDPQILRRPLLELALPI